LNFQTPDRAVKDMGGMRSTSISAFAYPKLVAALGLPPRLPKIEDTGQMLALPDLDVLDALGCDAVTILDGVTNAFPQPELWHDYDFNGRLQAQVRWPEQFKAQPDGTIVQWGRTRMVPGSTVFDDEHGGQPLDLSADLPKVDLIQFKKDLEAGKLKDEGVKKIKDLCQRVRNSSDRAVFFNDGAVQVPMGIAGYGGLATFSMQCITEPDYVAELHEIATQRTLQNMRLLLPEIRDNIDILILAADDWGTQSNLIASPKVYQQLFMPFYRRLNDECHRIAPTVKLFLHSCGAIYNLLDLIVETGFDILNPVQWPAGGHSYQEWKDKARGRIVLWGGGVNSQETLPLGTTAEVANEAAAVTEYMNKDGGFVFCNVHNILAEIAAEKVIAMYAAAR
jgi:uroporphyrinogen decarboxylase